jgi:hypothetical protein
MKNVYLNLVQNIAPVLWGQGHIARHASVLNLSQTHSAVSL